MRRTDQQSTSSATNGNDKKTINYSGDNSGSSSDGAGIGFGTPDRT
jgi:hypothetical protein